MEAILFHCPQMSDLAARICAADQRIKPGKISWKRFEDDTEDLRIGKVDGSRQKRAAFLASLDSPEDYFRQISIIYAMPRYGYKEFKVILPFYPTGTMERGDTEDQVVTAKTLATVLSATPLNRGGPVEIVLYDIHTLGQRHYFGPSILTRYKTGTKYLKQKLEGDDWTIMFPDIGAWKRFRVMFDGSKSDGRKFAMGYCDKIRDGAKRIVTLKEGDVKGRRVVIVDDIIRSGGTILECAKALAAAGAAEVSAYATHGVFPKNSWEKFLDAGLAKVWITDSCPKTAVKVAGKGPFEVLSLDRSIARVIMDDDDVNEDRFPEE
jgi:ribose-phosphate pyrophosphokinase